MPQNRIPSSRNPGGTVVRAAGFGFQAYRCRRAIKLPLFPHCAQRIRCGKFCVPDFCRGINFGANGNECMQDARSFEHVHDGMPGYFAIPVAAGVENRLSGAAWQCETDGARSICQRACSEPTAAGFDLEVRLSPNRAKFPVGHPSRMASVDCLEHILNGWDPANQSGGRSVASQQFAIAPANCRSDR